MILHQDTTANTQGELVLTIDEALELAAKLTETARCAIKLPHGLIFSLPLIVSSSDGQCHASSMRISIEEGA